MMMILPVAILLAAGALLYVVAVPERVLLFVPLLLAFEHRVRVGNFSFDLSECCAVIICFLWVVQPRQDGAVQQARSMPSHGALIVLIALSALPGAVLEGDLHHAFSVYRDLMLPLVFLLGFLHLGLDRTKVVTLIKLTCVFAAANACLGIVQYFTGSFLGNLDPEELDWQATKTGFARLTPVGQFLGVGNSLPAGLYNETNNFATYLSVPLCLVSTLAFCPQLTRRQRLLCGTAGVIMLGALIFSLFRSGLLIYTISMLLVFLLRSKRVSVVRLVVVLGLVAGLASIFLTPGFADFDQFGSFQGRLQMISETLNMISAHPQILLSGGFTDFYLGHYREIQNIHNFPLYSTVQFGLPATIFFLIIFIRFFWRMLTVLGSSSGFQRDALLAIAVSLSANVLLYGQTTMLIDSVQTSIWLFFWMGCADYLACDLQTAAHPLRLQIATASATG